MPEKSVDVIIPSYKPDMRFISLLKRLVKQSVKPGKIIIINTDKSEWEALGFGGIISESSELLKACVIRHIKKSEFDHGRSRNFGVSLSDADAFICMTQDAVPCSRHLIENLISSLDNNVGISYARQIPYKDSGLIERFTRRYNYPENSYIKSASDVEKYGIKLYFASNVCAAFDRKCFDKLGGFPEGLVLNEDMIYASRLIKSGGSIYYSSKACVYHSHEYSGFMQFKRNFDIGASQSAYSDVFSGFKSEGEGKRLVKETALYLAEHGALYLLPKLFYISLCKYAGYLMGKRYKKLPPAIIKMCGLNHTYWQNYLKRVL